MRLLRLLPSATALLYPALLWAGPQYSPAFLLLALFLPLGALAAARQAHFYPAYPLARVSAYWSFAAPPLYTLLGGLLDFSQALPISSPLAWTLSWSCLSLLLLLERPSPPAPPRPAASSLGMAHGFSAAAISVFVLAHLLNHLLAWLGADAHLRFMAAARQFYRHPLLETLLLLLLVFQVGSGVFLLYRRSLPANTAWPTVLPLATAAYLAAFFLAHVSAVLSFRAQGIDTNWLWLKQTNLLTDPWAVRLGPYYFLGVVAFGVHAASGLRKVMLAHGQPAARANRLFAFLCWASVLGALLILAALLR